MNTMTSIYFKKRKVLAKQTYEFGVFWWFSFELELWATVRLKTSNMSHNYTIQTQHNSLAQFYTALKAANTYRGHRKLRWSCVVVTSAAPR